jgi:hypothetical protein
MTGLKIKRWRAWALVAIAAIGLQMPAVAHAQPTSGPFATILFSRSEVTAADNCVVNSTNIARLDTVVAPYLAARHLVATGTLVTGIIAAKGLTCTHDNESMMASWSQATALHQKYGWDFVSHTATYPQNLETLTPEQSQAETCGSAQTIDAHGLPGGHGLIAYPGGPGIAHCAPNELCVEVLRMGTAGRRPWDNGLFVPAVGVRDSRA